MATRTRYRGYRRYRNEPKTRTPSMGDRYLSSLYQGMAAEAMAEEDSGDDEEVETPEERARRQSEERARRNAAVLASREAGAGYDGADQIRGDALTAFTWDADQTVAKIQSKIANGDFAGARTLYDKVRGTVADNIDDLSEFTRESVANAGPAGALLAKRAGALLQGGYNNVRVSMPDGRETTIGDVLSENGTFQDDTKRSLRDLGYNDTVAEMYFGDHGEVAQTLARMVVDPQVRARSSGRLVPNSLQTADLMSFLSQRGGADGSSLVNLDRMNDLFGNSSANVVSAVVNSREGAGDYRRVLSNVMDAAAAMRLDGEDGAALASRVLSTMQNVQQSAQENLREGGPTPRDDLAFDSMFAKTAQELARRGLPMDPSSPAFTRAFKDVSEQLAWFENLGVDPVGEASEGGGSYLDHSAKYAADLVAGELESPGMFNEYARLRASLEGVRGARTPTHAGGPRARSSDPMTKSLTYRSDMQGPDGIALGFSQEIAQAMSGEIRGGKTLPNAVKAVMGDPDKLKSLRDGIAGHVGRAMPFVNEEARTQIADRMIQDWASNGPRPSVEAAVDAVLEDASLFDNEDTEQQLRLWSAANFEGTGQGADWQKLLYQHYLQETPSDAARAAERTAAKMAELEKAKWRGENPQAVYEQEMAQGYYFMPVPLVTRGADGKEVVDEETIKGTPWLVQGKKHRGYVIRRQYGDRRRAATALGREREDYNFDREQELLRQQFEADRQAESDYNKSMMAIRAAVLKKQATGGAASGGGGPAPLGAGIGGGR